MIDLDTSASDGAKIRVIGVGGGGGNAINNMISKGLTGVEFLVANTDKQALDHNLAQIKIQIGRDTTRGLGAGANPEVGAKSVEESEEEIREAIKHSDMLFVTSGMGGGTGTGGAPTIAKIGQEMNSLVVGIVTKPFKWEGKKRMRLAEEGIEQLREYVDALIVIPNQKLLEIIDKNTSFKDAFQKVDEVLYNATRGISDIIGCHGVVNVDFADVQTVMKGMGDALMGIGTASGENRAVEATHNALNSPLLDGTSITGAKGVLVNITGGSDLTMFEIAEAVSIVEDAAGEDANLIHGVVQNADHNDEIMVTVVATGFNKEEDDDENIEYSNSNNISSMMQPGRINFNDRSMPNSKPGPMFKSKIPNGISRNLPVDKVAKSTTPASSKEFSSSPKGFNELRKYDSPAVGRRHGSETMQKPKANASSSNTFARSAMPERSGFLRKIMD